MGKKKKITVLLVAIIVLLAAGFGITITVIERNLESLQTIEMREMNLSQVPDGTFTGEFDMFPLKAEVEVTVQDHSITGINLIKHVSGQGQGAEALPAEVVASQSLTVDSVSGATYSSKVILLAIDDALQNAEEK